MDTVTVVGASLAGLSAVRALRAQSFAGRIVVVGDEPHLPYDRPPLSKEFLAGTMAAEDLALAGPELEDLDVEWRLGTRATDLDVPGSAVVLADGERVASDGVVVATGARPRTLPGTDLAGVHTLRTLDDAVALRAELTPGARLVVVGGGFIGAEVASTARTLGVDVTVVEAAPVPMAGALGERMGRVCASLHDTGGTPLHCATGPVELLGTGHVKAVRLADGRELDADVVVVGVGTTPNVEWLGATRITTPGGVLTDGRGATAIPAVVAVGDCAMSYSASARAMMRIEHWAHAETQPPVAVAALLGQPYQLPVSARVPYFWSDQYGHRLQFAGHRQGPEEPEVVEGDLDSRSFVAVYRHDDRPVAAFAMNMARPFTRWRRHLAAQAPVPDLRDAVPVP